MMPNGWEAMRMTTTKKATADIPAAKPIERMDWALPTLMQKEVLVASGNSPLDEEGKEGEDDPFSGSNVKVQDGVVEEGDDSVAFTYPSQVQEAGQDLKDAGKNVLAAGKALI